LHQDRQKITANFSWLSKKIRSNASNDVFIDGCNDSVFVANAFAKHFSAVYQQSSVNDSDESIIKSLLRRLPDEQRVPKLSNRITVELVDKCIHQLKVGKACGPDDLSAKHLINAHPLLTVHLCALFRAMVACCHVPDALAVALLFLY